MDILKYLIISSSCLSLFYLAYLIFSKNENNFIFLRFFLLFIITFSLLISLSNFKINLSLFQSTGLNLLPEMIDISKAPVSQLANTESKNDFNWFEIFKNIYLIITSFFILRLFWQLGIILKTYLNFEKEKRIGYKLVFTQNLNHSFSFFKWVFIPKEIFLEQNKIDKILAHEKIHVSQYHSIDVLLIELLSAVMWFNPLVWMMRNSIQLVHEYLADEGVLNSGIDKVKYQSLLLNLIAEDRFIRLPSGFNHSLIKKRIIMMTKSKTYTKTKAKLIALLSLAVALFILVSCINGIEETTGSKTMELEQTDFDNTTVDETEGLKIRSSTSSTIDNSTILFIVDGKKFTGDDINKIEPNTINSISVIKNKESLKKFTTNSKYESAIIIELKK